MEKRKTTKKKKESIEVSSKLTAKQAVPFISMLVVVFAVFAFFTLSKDAETKSATELFPASNESLVKWYYEAEQDVTLNEKGFVDGKVQKKNRVGDPEEAYTMIGAYTFTTPENAERFYRSLQLRNAFFLDKSIAIGTEKIPADCLAYQTKKIVVKGIPPANAAHVICQKDYAAIEVLVITYQKDVSSIAEHMALLIMKRV